MTNEKFIHDTKIVLKFIQIYCDDKHKDEPKEKGTQELIYLEKDLHVKIDYNLCSTCKDTFLLSYHKLQLCPHEEKPSCRKCPKPCYERPDWKRVAKIMKHSGMKQGLLKVKKLLKFNFK
jgi:predicted amidophosphoribosyltransferase